VQNVGKNMANTNTFPEPVWDVSQPYDEACSSLIATGNTPFILSGVLKRLLQYHFCDAKNITNPMLKGYLWDTDEKEAHIYIALDYERNNEIVQQRPALLVRRKAMRTHQVGFKDESLPAITKKIGVYEGHKHQIYLLGNHDIICVGKTGGEAENLAEEVFFRMLHYMPVIRNDLRIGSFRVDGIGETTAVGEEPHKIHFVPVQMSWSTVHRWIVIPETPLLKRLGLVFEPFKDEFITGI
jgi:hypothetical protein